MEEPILRPRRGAVALCSIGRLGLITSDHPVQITYEDGNEGQAWLGIQLTDGDVTGVGKDKTVVKHQHIGDPWSSRTPLVLGYIDRMITELVTDLSDQLKEAAAERLAIDPQE